MGLRPADYLVPPEGYLTRNDDRDDRVISRLVKRVAQRAGVDAHVHDLRAAFAVYYLEANPGDVEALQELMGHRSIATTHVYQRKLGKQAAMDASARCHRALPSPATRGPPKVRKER